MKGWISKEFVAWCGNCSVWRRVSAERKSGAVSQFRQAGWKKTKAHGWQCPQCLASKKQKKEKKPV